MFLFVKGEEKRGMKSRGQEGVSEEKLEEILLVCAHRNIFWKQRGALFVWGSFASFLFIFIFLYLSIYLYVYEFQPLRKTLWLSFGGTILVFWSKWAPSVPVSGWCPKPFHFTGWIEPQSKMVTHSARGTLWTGVNMIPTSNYPGRLRNGFNEVSVPDINNSRANPENSKGKASYLIITGSC